MSQERPIRLHAGPWSLEFERWSGWVRSIRLGGHEVVRAIYAVVRGERWQTYSQRIVHTHICQEESCFSADWTVEVDELAFKWNGRLNCDGKGLSVEWTGTTMQPLVTRRTGLCLLHPQELAGTECSVRTETGNVEGQFPDLVAPYNPFNAFSEIEYPVGGGKFRAEFFGDPFSMEDQRNWTDSSFKTYCLPNPTQEPYEMRPGQSVHHVVSMSEVEAVTSIERLFATLSRTGAKVKVPLLGTVSNHDDSRFAFRLEPEIENPWNMAGMGKIFEVAGNFVELNRKLDSAAAFEGVAYWARPHVHAFDDRSTMENAHGLGAQVATVRHAFPSKKVLVGPIRFGGKLQGVRPSMNPDLPAAWFLAAVLELARAGADAACFFEVGDFRGKLGEVLALLQGSQEIEVLETSDKYRAVGFVLGNGSAVMINMRPIATTVRFEEELILSPYEILVLAQD